MLSPGLFEIGRHPPAGRLLMADCLRAFASKENTALQYTSLPRIIGILYIGAVQQPVYIST